MTRHNQPFAPAAIKHIIWDSALTLVSVRRWSFIREIGLLRSLGMLIRGFTPKKTRQRIYDILTHSEGVQSIDVQSGEDYVRDETGVILPAFIVEKWLASKLSDAQIIELIDLYVDAWASAHHTTSRFENISIKKIMHAVFAAESIVRNTKPIKKASHLVKKCGAKKYTQYILSNWQKESFEKIYALPRNQGLFSFFSHENIISSGSCGLVKPHRSIFEYLLNKNNLNAQECLFIDDQEENIRQARACGMQAILLERGNYKKLEHELRNLQIL